MRTLFLTDIHGQYTKAMTLLESVNYDSSKDKLILGGDYFDRGPENAELAKWLISIKDNENVIMLRGNHDLWLRTLLNLEDADVILYKDFKEISHMEQNNGGDATLKQLSNLYIDNSSLKEIAGTINKNFPGLKELLNDLKWYYETDNEIFTHSTLPLNYENANDEDWVVSVWRAPELWAQWEYGLDKDVYIGHLAVSNITGQVGSTKPIKLSPRGNSEVSIYLCDGDLGWYGDGMIVEIK